MTPECRTWPPEGGGVLSTDDFGGLMSATEQNYSARDRIRSVLKVWVLTLSGTASVVLAGLALTRPY